MKELEVFPVWHVTDTIPAPRAGMLTTVLPCLCSFVLQRELGCAQKGRDAIKILLLL